jgi:T5SS/PEP-CTERM-associated repeat protein
MEGSFSDARVFMGRWGSGALRIDGGGVVSVLDPTLGGGADGIELGHGGPGIGGTASLGIAGQGSVLLIRGNGAFLNSGGPGAGSQTVEVGTGGLLRLEGTGSYAALTLGRGGGRGDLGVDGGRLELAVDPGSDSTAFITVGRDGVGDSQGLRSTLQVRGGGDVVLEGADSDWPGITVARLPGSSGGLAVQGRESRIRVIATQGTAGGISVGQGGDGRLDVSDGGRIEILTGSGPFGGLALGGPSGRGIGRVTGAGSRLALGGPSPAIVVGEYGQGSLSLADGASAASLDVLIGLESGASGLLELLGGASLELSGSEADRQSGPLLLVGGAGSGRMVVRDAAVSLMGESGAGPRLMVGGSPAWMGGFGELRLTGPEVSLTLGGQEPGIVSVGAAGTGVLRVEQGANLSLGERGTMSLGGSDDSIALLIIDGPGSRVEVGGTLWAGFRGDASDGKPSRSTAVIVVRNGGALKAERIVLGPNALLQGDGTVIGNIENSKK